MGKQGLECQARADLPAETGAGDPGAAPAKAESAEKDGVDVSAEQPAFYFSPLHGRRLFEYSCG